MSEDAPTHGAGSDRDRPEADLGRALDVAARELIGKGPEDLDYTLGLIVAGAMTTIPNVERAGISLALTGGVIDSRAPSDEVVSELDRLQSELREGPCLDSIWEQERTLIPDMAATGEQWPRFAPAARERNVGTMLSFQLFANNGSAGALNLYAETPHSFTEVSVDTGALFASHAAVALHGARRIEGLNQALLSRDVIGEAKGILIERFGLTEEAAFAMLVRSSQDTNMKLVAVARWLVDESTTRRSSTAT